MATKGEKIFLTVLGAIGSAYLYNKYQEEKAKKENRVYSSDAAAANILKAGVFGALGGRIAAGIIGTPNDTVNYSLRNGKEIVYEGIAFEHRIDSRIYEHEASGKKFTSFTFDKAKPRNEALDLEKFRIKKIKPHYNKQHNF